MKKLTSEEIKENIKFVKLIEKDLEREKRDIKILKKFMKDPKK